jgi:hypothetical protein
MSFETDSQEIRPFAMGHLVLNLNRIFLNMLTFWTRIICRFSPLVLNPCPTCELFFLVQ